MTKLSILIIDDEPLARERIRVFLRGNASVEIAGEYGNGFEALEAIRRDRPDIVFLDVEMPGGDGIQLLSSLPEESRPAIILATAHHRFAVDAFSQQVVDYLLKPFDKVRFGRALDRASALVRSRREGDLEKRVEGVLTAALGRQPQRLAVKADGRIVFLVPDEIVWVEAANNYCTVHLAGSKRLLLRETLSSIEKRLGASSFARVNRSAVVNVGAVQEMQPAKYGDYLVLLRTGERLPLSRSLRGRLKDIVNGGF